MNNHPNTNSRTTKSHPFRLYQELNGEFTIEPGGLPLLKAIRGKLKKFRAIGPEGWEKKNWTGNDEQEVFEKCRADLKESGFFMDDGDFRL